jgi:hypothetical protein
VNELVAEGSRGCRSMPPLIQLLLSLSPIFLLCASALPASHLGPLRELYKETPGKVFETTLGVAEMVKYLSNAFHAVKVTFANELGTLCKNLGVDAHAVLRSSRRIPLEYLTSVLVSWFCLRRIVLAEGCEGVDLQSQGTRPEAADARVSVAQQL